MKYLFGSGQKGGVNRISSFLQFLWRERRTWLAIFVLAFLYGYVIGVIRGSGEWLYVDEVGGNNFFWGDDAYRWFLARSAWIKPDAYWFNFALPVWLFLEGVLVTLSQNDLLHARYIKAVLTAVSVILVYRTCIRLGLARWAASAGAFLLATMPLYVFMGMSFYGESWLAFLMTASMYCYVHGHKKWFLLIVSVMPLVRPESILLILTFSAIYLHQRNWRYVVALLSCGGIFFLSIFAFSEPAAFFGWRAEASRVYQAQGEFYGWGGRNLLDVFAVPLVIPALIGMATQKVRPLYGFCIGALLFVLIRTILYSSNIGFFESRYYSPLMPIVIVGFVGFISSVHDLIEKNGFFGRSPYFPLVTLVVLVFGCHFYSLTTLRTALVLGIEHGTPFRHLSTNWEEGGKLYGLSLEEKAYFREYADVAVKMLTMNPDIKVLVVGNIQVFYFLDPELIPTHVRVVFSPFARPHLKDIFTASQASGYFAEPPFYGYFNLTDPTYEKDKILYLDYFPYADYPYKWRIGGSRMSGPNDIFLFGGHFLGMKGSEVIR
ncbi:MAG: hypothetical protein K0Q68_267 [Moraxellaceae bacterium]|jgi:hypothetical protein|nr:hypothetical protein [Moraxellaceae bacterium]